MVAFIIYWAAIIACIAWGVLSIWFSVFYLSRKENGKCLGFCVLQHYRYYRLSNCFISLQNLGFRYLTYSSLIYTILASLGVLTVLQAILGREPKAVKA